MTVDYRCLDSCHAEIARLEAENAALRSSPRDEAGALVNAPDDAAQSLITRRLERCLQLEQQNAALVLELAKIRHALAVEQVRGRLLAADSARRIGDAAFRAMVTQTESQVANGTTTLPTADLMVLLTSVPPAPDAG